MVRLHLEMKTMVRFSFANENQWLDYILQMKANDYIMFWKWKPMGRFSFANESQWLDYVLKMKTNG